MNIITIQAFRDELEKVASAGHALVDIAGLGILARPTIQKMQGKEVSKRSEHAHELAGLGTLAAGVAHEHRHEFADMARKGFGKLKGLAGKVVHASVKEARIAPTFTEPIMRKAVSAMKGPTMSLAERVAARRASMEAAAAKFRPPSAGGMPTPKPGTLPGIRG